MMPPKDVPAMSLYSTLSQTPRPFRVVDFPRLDDDGNPVGQVAIRAMNGAEYLSANVAADSVAREQFKGALKDSIGYANAYSTELRIEQLIRAVRDAEDPTSSVFKTAKEMRSVLSTEEIAALYLLFLDVTEQIGPVINAMTGAEIDAWIEKLVEGGNSADANSFIYSGQWKILALSLASRLGTLRMQRSSSGTPHDEPSASDENEPSGPHSMLPTDRSDGLDEPAAPDISDLDVAP